MDERSEPVDASESVRPSEVDRADMVDPSELEEILDTLDGVRPSERLGGVRTSGAEASEGERRGTGDNARAGGGAPVPDDGAVLGRRTDVSSEGCARGVGVGERAEPDSEGRRMEESYDASEGARNRRGGSERLEGVSEDAEESVSESESEDGVGASGTLGALGAREGGEEGGRDGAEDGVRGVGDDGVGAEVGPSVEVGSEGGALDSGLSSSSSSS